MCNGCSGGRAPPARQPDHASPPDAAAANASDALGATWPAALVSGTVDPRALAALNAQYQPRWAALWAAVHAVLAAGPDAHATLPEIAAADPGDRRFAAHEWNELPYFSLLKQGYLLGSRYLCELVALAQLPEPDKHRLVFMTRQYVDAIAPSNFVATNPEVIERALATDGASLKQGFANLVADTRKGRISMSDERAFAVGRNLAVTPGHVVFRNELIELIQYAPTTKEVRRRPLVIVPPCINKYYILDLQPENSFVRWAVGAGPHGVHHLVAQHSGATGSAHLGRLSRGRRADRDSTWRKEIAGSPTVNALGFCVGGTLLACALAVLAERQRPERREPHAPHHDARFRGSGRDRRLRVARIPRLARSRAAVGATRPRQRARRRLREPARERPRLELRRAQLPQGRDATAVRPAALERRFGEPARTDVRLLPAQPLSRQPAASSTAR